MSSTKEEDLSPNLGPRVDSDNTTSVFNEWTTIIPEEEKVEVLSKPVAPRFNPRRVLSETYKWGVTGITGHYSSVLLEVVALAGAKLAVERQVFAEMDPKMAMAVLVMSYAPLVHATLLNAKQAWHTLEEGDLSVSPTAKFAYNLSKRLTKNEKIHRRATFVGFSFWEVAKEIPWYAGAFWGDQLAQIAEKTPLIGSMLDSLVTNLTPNHTITNEELAYLTGANIFGAGYQYLQAASVAGIRWGAKEFNNRRIINIFRRGGVQITPNTPLDTEGEHLQKGS